MAVRLCSRINTFLRTFSVVINNSKKQYCGSSTNSRKFREIEIPVPWGHVAGKLWEPYETKLILSLHGWQDNCGTFDRLIPLLRKDIGFLAIDLPGQGYSSILPPGMYYDEWHTPILIKIISNYFKWKTVSLMGHSLGSASSLVYAMLYPKEVDFLILLDGLKPLIRKHNISKMGEAMESLLKYNEIVANQTKNEPPSYTLDKIREVVCKLNNNSIDIKSVNCILTRNLAQSKVNPDKYYFTRDPRLKARLVPNWCQQEFVEYIHRVDKIPICYIKATDSDFFEEKKNADEVIGVLRKVNSNFEYLIVEGTHHVHLNHPERVGSHINNFLEKYIIS